MSSVCLFVSFIGHFLGRGTGRRSSKLWPPRNLEITK